MPRLASVHWRTLERIFLRAGFTFVRQDGSHRAYTRKGTLRPIVIPTYDRVPVFIIKNNLKVAGLSRGDYFRLLESE